MPYITIMDNCLDAAHDRCKLRGGEGGGYHWCVCFCHWDPDVSGPTRWDLIGKAWAVASTLRQQRKSVEG
jgi:hypothetical protein